MEDPTITNLINDRIDLEESLSKLLTAFCRKYPRGRHTIECSLSYGDHLAPIVRVRSTF